MFDYLLVDNYGKTVEAATDEDGVDRIGEEAMPGGRDGAGRGGGEDIGGAFIGVQLEAVLLGSAGAALPDIHADDTDLHRGGGLSGIDTQGVGMLDNSSGSEAQEKAEERTTEDGTRQGHADATGAESPHGKGHDTEAADEPDEHALHAGDEGEAIARETLDPVEQKIAAFCE